MSWWSACFRREPKLDAGRAAALRSYRASGNPEARAALAAQRVVVVDVESSGLDPFRDRLISVGAVAARGGLVRLGDSFEVVLRQDQASDERNIVVHGIGGTAQMEGCDPAAGLADFLAFAGNAPLVGFNADFDRILIERATDAALGMKPHNLWLDLALIAPALHPGRGGARPTLDDWLQAFGIENHARHNALADALATAQLMLALLDGAARQDAGTLARLVELEKAQRWLGRGART